MTTVNLTSRAELMETSAGNAMASPAATGLVSRIRQQKMPVLPWKEYFEFVEKPYVLLIFQIPLTLIVADVLYEEQKQPFGVFRFIDYLAFFGMMFVISLGWVVYRQRDQDKRHQASEGKHAPTDEIQESKDIQTDQRPQRQDIQTNHIQGIGQHPLQHRSNSGSNRMDHTVQGIVLARDGNYFSLIEMCSDRGSNVVNNLVHKKLTLPEALDMMKQLEDGEGDGPSTPLALTSATESNPGPTLPVSSYHIVVNMPNAIDAGDLAGPNDVVHAGSRVLHRRIEIGPGGEFPSSQILDLLSSSSKLDKDSTLQVGSSGILKITDEGLRVWTLEEDETPTILGVHRSSRSFLEIFTGEAAKWTVRGFNLQKATLKVVTKEKSENVKVLHHYKTRNGIDVLSFKEPRTFIWSMGKVYISASKAVELESEVTCKLYSEAKIVQKVFWTSVLDSCIPSPWSVATMASLTFITGLIYGPQWRIFVACCFVTLLPNILSAFCLRLQLCVRPEGGMGGYGVEKVQQSTRWKRVAHNGPSDICKETFILGRKMEIYN